MRQIKFRAKSVCDDGRFVYGDLLHKKDGSIMVDDGMIGTDVNENTIGQFSGQTDKDGKELYEGDIICSSGFRYPVLIVYDDEGCRFAKKRIHDIGDPLNSELIQLGGDYWKDFRKKVSLMGNRYDNPEMLNEEWWKMKRVESIKGLDRIKYIRCKITIDDYDINGQFCNDGKTPMSSLPYLSESGNNTFLWSPVIDVEKGLILNWEGVQFSICFKVCDMCEYDVIDGKNDVIHHHDGYVPSILFPEEEGYGDYVIMDIDADGTIKNWNNKRYNLADLMEK